MAIIPSEYDGKVSSKDVPSLNINKDIVMPYFLWLYLSRPSFYKKQKDGQQVQDRKGYI